MTQTREGLIAALNDGASGFGLDLADEMAILPRAARRRQMKPAMRSLEGAVKQVAAKMGLGEADAHNALQVAVGAFDTRLMSITTTGGHA